MQVERDAKIGKLGSDLAKQQKVEILSALKKLGEQLNPSEENFLQTYSSDSLKKFEQVSGEIGKLIVVLNIIKNESNLSTITGFCGDYWSDHKCL